MKAKYEVVVEKGAGYTTVRTFKGDHNEANAIAFVNDQKNLRSYGFMTLLKTDQNGERFEWGGEQWVGAT